MKPSLFAGIALVMHLFVFAQSFRPVVSAGTRAALSTLNRDDTYGKGLGGHMRLQFSNRINTEWFEEHLSSKTDNTGRDDYFLGWSMMVYLNKNNDSAKIFSPYLIIGQSFDKTKVFELEDETNSANSQGVAGEAGLGTHINITKNLDCSFSAKYLLHFGREIETFTEEEEGTLVIQKAGESSKYGNLMFNVSLNYKLLRL